MLLIALMGLATYTTRVGLFGLARRVDLHPLLPALTYVRVSILAAVVLFATAPVRVPAVDSLRAARRSARQLASSPAKGERP